MLFLLMCDINKVSELFLKFLIGLAVLLESWVFRISLGTMVAFQLDFKFKMMMLM